MDSKTKRLTIVVMLCVMLLVAGIIVLVNYRQLTGGHAAVNEDSTAQSATQSALVEEDGKIKDADLSAFMQDETFFDQEKSKYSKPENSMEDSSGEMLSLLATSVEKDLRVKVVDHNGEPVAGQSFMIQVENAGEYKDLDQDGIIYIADLKPGEYAVTLKAAEGFQASAEPLKVTVKASVSYTPIDDITYLIKSESEVDVSIEDTASADAELNDSDDTQYTGLLEVEELESAVALGIDVSKWNGEIDWEVVKAEGVDFAIIRCGYRGSSSGSLIEDPYFAKNLSGAAKAGVKVGVYFFTQATNIVEAVEEASMVVTLLGDSAIQYPVYIDTESAGGNGRADGLDADTRTDVCRAFCKTIENAGYEAGIYASRNWFYTNLNVKQVNEYKIWLAEYRHTPLYDGKYEMWQYTSSGSVSGINGRVDLNVSYLGY